MCIVDTTPVLSPDQLVEARGWIGDCVWPDLVADDIEELTDADIIRGIKRHYDGGIEAFIKACD